MTKPKIGDIIKFFNVNAKEEEHFLVLGTSKQQTSLGHAFIRCDVLFLATGNIQKYDVYYRMKCWSKVA